MVDSPELSESTPTSALPFSIPIPYWLDVRSYDPVATAADLHKPMLILQGSRDYQSNVEEDFKLWQSGLQGREDITFRNYEGENHLFMSGTDVSSPAEYDVPSHVDVDVVEDITKWIQSYKKVESASVE